MPNKKRLIDEFIELVKIDSLTGKEKTLANLLVKKLKEIGFDVIMDEAGKFAGGEIGRASCRERV